MSYSKYTKQLSDDSELDTRIVIYSEIAKGLKDIKLGRVDNSEDAFSEILDELDKLDIKSDCLRVLRKN